jgi:hypothetical protein
MNDKIIALREKADRLEKEENDKKWLEARNKISTKLQSLINVPLIQFFTEHNWRIINPLEFHESYRIQGSGAQGQWDERRYFVLNAEIFSVFRNRDTSTEAGLFPIPEDSILPVKQGSRINSAWKRFIHFNEVYMSTTIISIGEEAYNNQDINELYKEYYKFSDLLYKSPPELWDIVKNHYSERLKLAEKLSKNLESLNIEIKSLERVK